MFEKVKGCFCHHFLLLLEPLVVAVVFVTDELCVLQIRFHSRRNLVCFDAASKSFCFADEDDGAAAVEPEWRPEVFIVAPEDFSVEFTVAWPGSLVEDRAVLPVRKLVFYALQAGELGSGVAEGAFGAVDPLQPPVSEPGRAEFVELAVYGVFPFFEALPFLEGFGKTVLEGCVDPVIFDQSGREAFKGVECGGRFVATADVAGDADFGEGCRSRGFGFVFKGFSGKRVDGFPAVDPRLLQMAGEGAGKGVDEVLVGLKVENVLNRCGQGFFFNRSYA